MRELLAKAIEESGAFRGMFDEFRVDLAAARAEVEAMRERAKGAEHDRAAAVVIADEAVRAARTQPRRCGRRGRRATGEGALGTAQGREGTCIKHRFGKCSIKMYDKHGIVLRIETTANDVSFFKHHRKVEHRKGPATRGLAPVKKSIYSLILGACRNGPSSAHRTGPSERAWVCDKLVGSADNRASLR